MSSLVETFVSKASALQRQGRAGRVRNGFCLRLYPKYRYGAHRPLCRGRRKTSPVSSKGCVHQISQERTAQVMSCCWSRADLLCSCLMPLTSGLTPSWITLFQRYYGSRWRSSAFILWYKNKIHKMYTKFTQRQTLVQHVETLSKLLLKVFSPLALPLEEMSVRLPGGLSEQGPGSSSASVGQQRRQPAEEDRCVPPQQPCPHPSGTPPGESARQREDWQDAHLWSHPRLPGAHSTSHCLVIQKSHTHTLIL